MMPTRLFPSKDRFAGWSDGHRGGQRREKDPHLSAPISRRTEEQPLYESMIAAILRTADNAAQWYLHQKCKHCGRECCELAWIALRARAEQHRTLQKADSANGRAERTSPIVYRRTKWYEGHFNRFCIMMGKRTRLRIQGCR